MKEQEKPLRVDIVPRTEAGAPEEVVVFEGPLLSWKNGTEEERQATLEIYDDPSSAMILWRKQFGDSFPEFFNWIAAREMAEGKKDLPLGVKEAKVVEALLFYPHRLVTEAVALNYPLDGGASFALRRLGDDRKLALGII